MDLDLTLIWAILIATAVFLYVAMDGFDLGLGILFPAVRGKAERDVMVNSVAPVWDGNETWLVLGGGGLFAVFPLAYATILPALYMPLILMLLALVFRGVAFEMRFRMATPRGQLWWTVPSPGAASSPPSARGSRSAPSSRASGSRAGPMRAAGGTG